MILIRKGREPEELIRHRKQPGATYGNMPAAAREQLLASLMAEQHHLCAYCTCRIPQEGGRPPVSIEHFHPQTPADKAQMRPGWDLRYSNMLAVCSGNRGCEKKSLLTCDACKANRITRLSPTDPTVVQKLRYQSDGTITSDDAELRSELETVLNLNSRELFLPRNRKALLRVIQAKLPSGGTSAAFRAACAKVLQELRATPEPFCGMALEWLARKAK